MSQLRLSLTACRGLVMVNDFFDEVELYFDHLAISALYFERGRERLRNLLLREDAAHAGASCVIISMCLYRRRLKGQELW